MAGALQAVMNALMVANGAACGEDAAYNAIRLAGALACVCPVPPDGPLILVASAHREQSNAHWR
jgi:hypothetical protein